MGEPIKIIDLATDLIKLSGYEPELEIPIKITGTRPGEKKTEELSFPAEHLDKTKHNKIFVAKNNFSSENDNYDNIIFEVKKLKDELKDRNPNKIRNFKINIERL